MFVVVNEKLVCSTVRSQEHSKPVLCVRREREREMVTIWPNFKCCRDWFVPILPIIVVVDLVAFCGSSRHASKLLQDSFWSSPSWPQDTKLFLQLNRACVLWNESGFLCWSQFRLIQMLTHLYKKKFRSSFSASLEGNTSYCTIANILLVWKIRLQSHASTSASSYRFSIYSVGSWCCISE